MSGPNWSALVEQGRAKAMGVSWSDAELNAIYKLKIPVEFVRAGCLTLEDLERAKKDIKEGEEQGKEKPLRYMRKDELLKTAQQLKIDAQNETTRAELILLIEEKLGSTDASRRSG